MTETVLDQDFSKGPQSANQVAYAGFWIRAGASILDALILIPLTAFSFYNTLSLKSFALMALTSMLLALYKPILEWQKGATWGKMAVGIKLVDEQFKDITLSHAMKRYLPWGVTYLLGFITNAILFNSERFGDLNEFMEIGLHTQDSAISTVSMLFNVLFLVAVVWVAFDERKQGLHDKFAGTYCIYDKPTGS